MVRFLFLWAGWGLCTVTQLEGVEEQISSTAREKQHQHIFWVASLHVQYFQQSDQRVQPHTACLLAVHSQAPLLHLRPNKLFARSGALSDYSSLSDSQVLFGSQFCPENAQSAAPLELGMQLGQHNSQDVSFAPPFSPAQAHSHHPKSVVILK